MHIGAQTTHAAGVDAQTAGLAVVDRERGGGALCHRGRLLRRRRDRRLRPGVATTYPPFGRGVVRSTLAKRLLSLPISEEATVDCHGTLIGRLLQDLEPVWYQRRVIVTLHAATGATAGAALGSSAGAALLGVPLHLLGDQLPHEDMDSVPFEVASGLCVVALLAVTRGVRDPATVGALAACAPDVEHLVPLPRPGGRKLFHRGGGGHESRHISATLQLLLAGFLVGRLL